MIDYLVLHHIHCIDVPAFSNKLEIVDEGVLVGILVPAGINQIVLQILIATNSEYLLIGTQPMFLPIVGKGIRSKERIRHKLLLVLLLLLLGLRLFIIQIRVQLLEVFGFEQLAKFLKVDYLTIIITFH